MNTSNHINTYTFSDGLGRVLQTKINSVIEGVDSLIVSGKVIYDALGRATTSYYPITEALGTEILFKTNVSSMNPTRWYYDVMDRQVNTVMPDLTTSDAAFGFGADAFGKVRFKSTVTDPKNISITNHVDASGKTTSALAPLFILTN